MKGVEQIQQIIIEAEKASTSDQILIGVSVAVLSALLIFLGKKAYNKYFKK